MTLTQWWSWDCLVKHKHFISIMEMTEQLLGGKLRVSHVKANRQISYFWNRFIPPHVSNQSGWDSVSAVQLGPALYLYSPKSLWQKLIFLIVLTTLPPSGVCTTQLPFLLQDFIFFMWSFNFLMFLCFFFSFLRLTKLMQRLFLELFLSGLRD